MTMRLREGTVVGIPCRHCGRVWMRVCLKPGESRLACPSCRNGTHVSVRARGSDLEVRTRELGASEAQASL